MTRGGIGEEGVGCPNHGDAIKYDYDTERVLGAVVATDTQYVRLCHDRHMYDIACMYHNDQQNSTQHDAVIVH